jgi:hypothetical protein
MTKSITIDSSYFKRENPPQEKNTPENHSSFSDTVSDYMDLTAKSAQRKTLESILDLIYEEERGGSDIYKVDELLKDYKSPYEQIRRKKHYF